MVYTVDYAAAAAGLLEESNGQGARRDHRLGGRLITGPGDGPGCGLGVAGSARVLLELLDHSVRCGLHVAGVRPAEVDQYQPDAAVVDVRMPPGYTDEGLRAAIAIRRDHPKTGVLVFSQYIETRYTADLLGAASGGGAAGVGYLLKDRVADVNEFVHALSRVAAGGTALDPEVVTQLLGASCPTGSPRSPSGNATCSR